MSERINYRPEVVEALQQFVQFAELLDAVKGDALLEQQITIAILGVLSKIDLDAEELVLIDQNARTAQDQRPFSRPAVTKPFPLSQRERPRTERQVEPQSEPLPRITRGATRFYLCSASEGRLLRSLEDTGVVLVNEFLLAKVVGKMSVLALDTREGFTAGHWYAPRAQWMRDSIRQAFDKGLSRVTLTDDVWDYMREASVLNIDPILARLKDRSVLQAIDSEQALLEFARNIISQLPQQLPLTISDVQRREYREMHREGK